ncbi:hypothetical protein ONS95_001261 [Cadophora gregata]|uniref:uncharacterized protein n=1 Tax=Cadophora gregata TaxID=51156 RepID=UPI0026DB7BC7|nr:uncharacterized protein ONS95_001261 [Cadophora gregata]KAK0101927.1 hypothetical protein ONS96_005899 [Cadophora gregata f. sp. sojae]KAK0129333.1 hypothetical protein ONS95_001261 [Cadophora gregata]
MRLMTFQKLHVSIKITFTFNPVTIHCFSRVPSRCYGLISMLPELSDLKCRWRHIIPLLPPDIPLFIPDIPGYGRSAPQTTPHSKQNTGLSILNTLSTLLPQPFPFTSLHRIILAGHDRGAHISQRLTVSNPHPSFQILGTILLDITPSLTRWSSFSTSSTAVGGFHWPFLANAALATSMITSFGGEKWARFCLERWSGNSPSALAKFKENEAWEVYMNDFRRESVVRASCDDYRAGAEEDVVAQEEDQKAGRKMDCPVLKVYSELFLGSNYDMRAVWEEFMVRPGDLELVSVGWCRAFCGRGGAS